MPKILEIFIGNNLILSPRATNLLDAMYRESNIKSISKTIVTV